MRTVKSIAPASYTDRNARTVVAARYSASCCPQRSGFTEPATFHLKLRIALWTLVRRLLEATKRWTEPTPREARLARAIGGGGLRHRRSVLPCTSAYNSPMDLRPHYSFLAESCVHSCNSDQPHKRKLLYWQSTRREQKLLGGPKDDFLFVMIFETLTGDRESAGAPLVSKGLMPIFIAAEWSSGGGRQYSSMDFPQSRGMFTPVKVL